MVVVIAFFNYRIKVQREAREQQQQPTMIMAEIVLEQPEQPVHDRTLEAEAFLDPTTVAAAQTTDAAVADPPVDVSVEEISKVQRSSEDG
jgi:hypothetical protein